MHNEDQFMVNHVANSRAPTPFAVTGTNTDGQVLSTVLSVYAQISGQYYTAALAPGTGMSPYQARLQIQAPSDLTRRTVLDFEPGKVTFGLGPPRKAAADHRPAGAYVVFICQDSPSCFMKSDPTDGSILEIPCLCCVTDPVTVVRDLFDFQPNGMKISDIACFRGKPHKHA